MKNVIAIDFDGTLWDGFKVINKEKVNSLYENPENFIVIYTARSYSQFETIRNILLKWRVKFGAIVCEKLRADVYIDDKNSGGLLW
jgi:hydroxymethylpyrimidine pyrophosphatase-like HAD family hydrolase